MELIFDLKYDKNREDVKAEMFSQLWYDGKFIELKYYFKLSGKHYGKEYENNFDTILLINLKTGDFEIKKKNIENNKIKKIIKKNNFSLLSNIIHDTMLSGHRNERFWGVKIRNYYHKVSNFIEQIFDENITTPTVKVQNFYEKLYSVIVHFHLNKNDIKPHNNIFFNILFDYPKKKHLKNNDNKYVSSVLEFYGIKNKYFVSEINKPDNNIVISTLKCLTDIFGENYIDFVRKIPLTICDEPIRPRTKYILKNNVEKNNMVSLINKMVKNEKLEIIKKVYKLMELYDFIDRNNISVKFKPEHIDDFDVIYDTLNEYKKFFNRNFIYTFTFPEKFLNIVEEDIVYKNKKYTVNILKSELDFLNESVKMKNCLLTHFYNGNYYLYLSIFDGEKTTDIQIRNNKIFQIYGKANSDPSKEMKEVSEILLNKIVKFGDVKWEKTMIDFKDGK